MCFGKAIDLKTSGGYQLYIFTTYSEHYGVRPRTWGQSEMAYFTNLQHLCCQGALSKFILALNNDIQA